MKSRRLKVKISLGVRCNGKMVSEIQIRGDGGMDVLGKKWWQYRLVYKNKLHKNIEAEKHRKIKKIIRICSV